MVGFFPSRKSFRMSEDKWGNQNDHLSKSNVITTDSNKS